MYESYDNRKSFGEVKGSVPYLQADFKESLLLGVEPAGPVRAVEETDNALQLKKYRGSGSTGGLRAARRASRFWSQCCGGPGGLHPGEDGGSGVRIT